MNDDARALIITVNTRHPECTLRFLDSISSLDGFPRCDLLIVDNNSDDGSVSRIRQAISGFSNVELLASQHNRGYFGAASWALRHYLESHSVPDWVVVSNDDIEFEDSQFLRRLFQKDPMSAGVIAPSIISSLTAHDANPSVRRRPSRLRMWRYRLWLSNYYAMWFKQWLSPYVRKTRYRFSNRTPAPAKGVRSQIYAPHGAFLIFSRKFFEAGGFIDDGFFLYAEEFCVAEMCRQLRLPVIHDPNLRVRHAESQTLGRMLSRRAYQHQKNGFRYIMARYNSSYPELGAALGTSPLGAQTTLPDAATDRHPFPATGEHVR
jgi:GT2 family glycosyltransferase